MSGTTSTTRRPSAATRAAEANAAAVKVARPGSKPAIHVAAPAPAPTMEEMAAAFAVVATPNGKKAKTPKEPKPDVSGAKNALASLIVRVAGEAIEALSAEDPIRAIGTTETIATLASRWLHYLPVGATWPQGFLPVPPRSEWNADGTRV